MAYGVSGKMTERQAIEFVRTHFPITHVRQIADFLGVSISQLYKWKKIAGVESLHGQRPFKIGELSVKFCSYGEHYTQLENFYTTNVTKGHSSGYDSWCKECKSEAFVKIYEDEL